LEKRQQHPQPNQDELDRLRLIRTEGVGPVAYRRMLARYGSASEAIAALPALVTAGGRSAPPAIPSRDDAAHELQELARLGGRMLFLGGSDYPPLLAMLDDAPACIAVLGDANLLPNRAVAMVGGRNASANGQLFAVPGSPLDPRSRGGNDLIRQGAHLTETAQDVLDNLPDHPAREGLARSPLFVHGTAPTGFSEPPPAWSEPRESAADLCKAREQVIDLLETSPTAVDDVVRRCQFSAAAVMAVLLELELAGRIETLPGSRVALLPETAL